jgi:hypothetical protein
MSSREELDAKLDLIRMENERYLRQHPELKKMISEFMVALLKDKPKEVLPYAVVFFTSSQVELD